MRTIRGIEIDNFQLDGFRWVGDLVYFDGPFVSVYERSGKIFVWKWAERGENYHRWIVYEIDHLSLSQFLYNETSHFQLLSSPATGMYYLVDVDGERNVIKSVVVAKGQLPLQYFPKRGVKHDRSLTEDSTAIIEYFDLKRPETYKIEGGVEEMIQAESRHSNGELFDIHVRDGIGLKGGSPNAGKLGLLLSGFQEISTAVGFGIYGQNNPKRRLTKSDKEEITGWSELDWWANRAASFVILLRPRSPITLLSNQTSTEKIASFLFRLFKANPEDDDFAKSLQDFSDSVLTAYRKLLTSIKIHEMVVDFGWTNAEKDISIRADFDAQKATKIIFKIDSVYNDFIEDRTVRGYFIAIDIDSHQFKFTSNQEDKYVGKFDSRLQESTQSRNFQTYYEVNLSIVHSQKVGHPNKMGSEVTMLSCIEIVNDEYSEEE